MLGPGRYLLGVTEILLLGGCAWLGASRARSRLLPCFEGAPAQLATAVLALALLIWVAELLGSVSLLTPGAYLVGVAVAGIGAGVFGRGRRRGGAVSLALRSAQDRGTGAAPGTGPCPSQAPRGGTPPHPDATGGGGAAWMSWAALLIAIAAVVHFAAGVRLRLSTGMTGFDSTWYHGPFAAGFFQSGNTWDLHFIAPQFLAWFYPANGEIFHAVGMLAFGRDLLSPLLNLGWFVGCLVACWCIGRPYRVGVWSLALGALALSVPALADQAGEARNDIVGIFFLLAAVAVALNAFGLQEDRGEPARETERPRSFAVGPLVVAGLAAGLAAGTKLNFLLPAAVLVLGLAFVAPRGARLRALLATALAALAGGGYWYLRNLAHAGSPLPWVHHLGPLSLPAPAQALGGREAHSVLGYLGDGSVWSGWFLPGLHHGLWLLWPLLAAAALAGLVLCLVPASRGSLRTDAVHKEPRDLALVAAGLAGLASALAWLVAPTSASGPAGMPHGFESGLRYLAPALVLGLALLPAAPLLRARAARLARVRQSFSPHTGHKDCRTRVGGIGKHWIAAALVAVLVLVAAGYPVQRHYLRSRYADPSFSAPGLDDAFKWARSISGARIATTSTRQYPLFGTDLSNRVQFVGEARPHGGFAAPTTCSAWRRALDAGHYDYVVASRDRLEPGQPPYPPQARWTEAPQAQVILRKPPTVVFELNGPLDPSSCGS